MNSEAEGETYDPPNVYETSGGATELVTGLVSAPVLESGHPAADQRELTGASRPGESSVTGGSGEAGGTAAPTQVRLQKVLAAAGLGSRRACEQLIAGGRVAVDGVIVDQLGARVDPSVAEVTVDGRRVSVAPGVVHLALNKPRGVLSAMSDDRGRPTVGDLVRDRPERLFHVGRLDADSEGLLLLTNDGPLAHFLMHPSHGVQKTYLAEVDGVLSRETLRRLLSGVELEDGSAQADAVKIVQASGQRSLVEVVLHEGRNRIVRRLLAEVGHPVRRLVRTALGSVALGSQRPGTIRELSVEEVSSLYSLVGQPIRP
jgi:23S rRNA pseudouridine2605 synthase